MKLSNEFISYLINILETARMLKIEDIVIEQSVVRGAAKTNHSIDHHNVAIFSKQQAPDMPFDAFATDDAVKLLRFIKTAQRCDDFAINAGFRKYSDGDSFPLFLHITNAAGLSCRFTCRNPESITAPKMINDNLLYRVPISKDIINLVRNATQTCNTDIIKFFMINNKLTFTAMDYLAFKTSDSYTAPFGKVKPIENRIACTEFEVNYLAKTIDTVFKNNTNGYFTIGEKSIMHININDIDVYLLSRNV